MKKRITYLILGVSYIVVAILLCRQNRELKNITIEHKNTIEDFYIKVDSLEKEIDTLIYSREMSKFNLTEEDILNAIITIESESNDSAYNSVEDAVGCLQIRRVMVDDVNRILEKKDSPLRFTYEDRWNREKSIEIFNIFCTYYGFKTAEDMARAWNGGPRGIDKPSTLDYWYKVEDALSS